MFTLANDLFQASGNFSTGMLAKMEKSTIFKKREKKKYQISRYYFYISDRVFELVALSSPKKGAKEKRKDVSVLQLSFSGVLIEDEAGITPKNLANVYVTVQ